MDVAAIFAVNLREKRAKAGLTRTALADAVGVSELMIYNYEKPTNFPRAEVLNRLCEVLAVAPWELLVPPGASMAAEPTLDQALAVIAAHLGYDLRKRG